MGEWKQQTKTKGSHLNMSRRETKLETDWWAKEMDQEGWKLLRFYGPETSHRTQCYMSVNKAPEKWMKGD